MDIEELLIWDKEEWIKNKNLLILTGFPLGYLFERVYKGIEAPYNKLSDEEKSEIRKYVNSLRKALKDENI